MKFWIAFAIAIAASFGAGKITNNNIELTAVKPMCFSDDPSEVWCEFEGISLIFSNRDFKEITIGLSEKADRTLSVADLDLDGTLDSLTYTLNDGELDGDITDTDLDGEYDYIFLNKKNDRIKIGTEWIEVIESGSSKSIEIDGERKSISFKEHPYRYTIE